MRQEQSRRGVGDRRGRLTLHEADPPLTAPSCQFAYTFLSRELERILSRLPRSLRNPHSLKSDPEGLAISIAMEERRFDDDEVAEIFRRAAAVGSERPQGSSRSGMTLAELQDIGREVGVSPDRIAAVASTVGQPASTAGRGKSFGMPMAVSRTLELPRALTDREWYVLVGELREVFAAAGRENSRGEARRWSNGNLFAIVEPTESGHRLRLGTRKSDALAYNLTGMVLLLLGLVGLIGLLEGDRTDQIATGVLFSVIGAGLIGYNGVRLPAWADERERQMDHIAERALTLAGRGEPSAEVGVDKP